MSKKNRRTIPKYTETQIKSRLNTAYRILLGGEIDGESVSASMLKEFGELVQRDLANISEFGSHPLHDDIEERRSLIMEGRRQVVSYMLSHLDFEPINVIELTNDALIQAQEIIEDGN